jgi:hypothetical protein
VVQEPEGSSPHSQQPATGPCPEPVESNPHPPSQSARHRSLSWASRIQSTHPKPISVRSILMKGYTTKLQTSSTRVFKLLFGWCLVLISVGLLASSFVVLRNNNRWPYFQLSRKQCKQAVIGLHNNETFVYGLLLICSQSVFGNRRVQTCVCLVTDSGWFEDLVLTGKLREEHVSLYRGRWRHSIVGASAG